MRNKLYVGNLAGNVATSRLEELFGPHGFVMDIRLVAGDQAGQALGFAFVTMATAESGRAAMRALDGASLHEAVIKVEEAGAEGAGGRAGSGGKP